MDPHFSLASHLQQLSSKLTFRDDQHHQAKSDGWDFSDDRSSRRRRGIHATGLPSAPMPMLEADDVVFRKVIDGALDARVDHRVVASRCLTALALTMLDFTDVSPKTARYRNVIRGRFWGKSLQHYAENEGWGLFYRTGSHMHTDEFRLGRHDRAGIFDSDEAAIAHVAKKLAQGDNLLELHALCYLAACHDPAGDVDEMPITTPEQSLVAQQLEYSLLCAQRMGLFERLQPLDVPHDDTVQKFCQLIDRFTTNNPVLY